MSASYSRRVSALEQQSSDTALSLPRFLIGFVNTQREVESVLAGGQWFRRTEGESDDDLCKRAREAVGWDGRDG